MKWISSTPGAQISLETGICVGSDRIALEAGKLELAKQAETGAGFVNGSFKLDKTFHGVPHIQPEVLVHLVEGGGADTF